MKERPILFSAPMVRAILAGTKTQTRRAMKDQPQRGSWPFPPMSDNDQARIVESCPYGQPGDRLWVRETFMDLLGTGVEHRPDPRGPLQRYAYASDHQPGSYGDEARKSYGLKWKPSIHMPRSASRITLEITGVRVERLQSISEADAVAEGASCRRISTGDARTGLVDWWFFGTDAAGNDIGAGHSAKNGYELLWESINSPGSWAANPWVWAVEFKRAEGAAA